jgi:predicted dehydrogenase
MGVALIGAGAIGRMHAQRCLHHGDVQLVALADPSASAQALAAELGVPWFADHRHMLDAHPVAAAIVATPNGTHLPIGRECLARGITPLIEKPLAGTLDDGQALCEASVASGVPVLVAHHRRHNPITQQARGLVAGGAVGRPVAAHASAWWLKPAGYFDLAWRRQPGGGPVLINLIHDIDQLRFIMGEVTEVQAICANAQRGFEVEDTAAVLLRFANGALGTLTVTDAAVSPWNWDLAAGEADHYVQQAVDTLQIAGTQGALAVPSLTLWRYDGTPGWQQPLTRQATPVHKVDPYIAQLSHLRAVAQRRTAPLCDAHDALRTLQVALAVHESARRQGPVSLTA